MQTEGYLLGIDIGSSSVKASLVDVKSGSAVSTAQSPSSEMAILSLQPGWAEQDPALWWKHVIQSIRMVLGQSGISPTSVLAIGISYQMHGLVITDHLNRPVRPAIIWCDSRAVRIGASAQDHLGESFCLKHYLNTPGNFTASKLKWVQVNEPENFGKIYKAMLPGDYIALKLTGQTTTTTTGLSEEIFWDYQAYGLATDLLEEYGIDKKLLPEITGVFSEQGKLTPEAARELGLTAGTPITYRAGDQPNNAFSLNVLEPGETAATAGTSGVIYTVTDKPAFDLRSRVNTFIHVNDGEERKRNGVLLCINGAGILNGWLRKNIMPAGDAQSFEKMNAIAIKAPIGAGGLSILPFGNGAERIFENKSIGASFHGLDFNRHDQASIFRAAQEGIVFAMRYGFEVLEQMGLRPMVIKAGHANLFLSPLFREAFVNTIGLPLERYNTDGATGAAVGAGLGAGIYKSNKEAFQGLKLIELLRPEAMLSSQYNEAFGKWKEILNRYI